MRNCQKSGYSPSSPRKRRKTSDILKNLNHYVFRPKRSTAKKMKYYFGPYSKYQCVRKFAPPPFEPKQGEENQDSGLWSRLTSYILEDMDKNLSVNHYSNQKRRDFIKNAKEAKKKAKKEGRRALVDTEFLENNRAIRAELLRSPENANKFPKLQIKAAAPIKKKKTSSFKVKTPSSFKLRTPIQDKKELNKYLPNKFFPMTPVMNKKKLNFNNSITVNLNRSICTFKEANKQLDNFNDGCERGMKSINHNSSYDTALCFRPRTQLDNSTDKTQCDSSMVRKSTKNSRRIIGGDKMKLLYQSFGVRVNQNSRFRRQMIQKAHKRFSSLEIND